MIKALVLKELRETAGITIAAFAAYMAIIINQMGYNILPFLGQPGENAIPFMLTDNFLPWFFSICIFFSIGLGLWQTVTESARGTWLFLLHHPMSRKKIIAVKLAIGAGIYLGVSALAVLIYACWAAMPATHASPFYWWMTHTVWRMWLLTFPCYLGAFLSGMRPGRWIGTRLLPLAAAGLLTILITGNVMSDLKCPILAILLAILLCAYFVSVILFVARSRDFA